MNCDPFDSKEEELFAIETLTEQYHQEKEEYFKVDDGYYSGSGCDEI